MRRLEARNYTHNIALHIKTLYLYSATFQPQKSEKVNVLHDVCVEASRPQMNFTSSCVHNIIKNAKVKQFFKKPATNYTQRQLLIFLIIP